MPSSAITGLLRLALPALAFLTVATKAAAQERPASLTVNVTAQDAGDRYPQRVSGAVIELVSGQDTLRTSTNYTGQYIFKRLEPGEISVTVSHIAYKNATKTLELEPGRHHYLGFNLEDRAQEIEEVRVRGDAPMITVRGDTLIYNASAVNTLEGDEAIEILRQMPGVEVSEDGSVSILGEDIKRTYINGRLIFGNDPREALMNLLAREVVNIKVYEEAPVAERKRGIRRTADMEKVLDIKTRDPIISAASGHVLASLGSDFARNDEGNRQPRYGAGFTGNYFSEKFLLSTNTYLNNINRRSNRLDEMHRTAGSSASYDRTQNAALSAEYYWGERWKEDGFEVSYAFRNDYGRTNNITELLYFPSENYSERYRSDSSRSVRTAQQHSVSAGTSFYTSATGEIGFRAGLNFTDNHSDSYQRRFTSQDGETVENGLQQQLSADNGYTYSQSLDWRPLARKENAALYVSGSFSFTISENEGNWTRSDTISDVTDRYKLFSTPVGRQKSLTGRLSLNRVMSADKGTNMGLGYTFNRDRTRSRQFAYDLLDDSLSVNNSWDYTYDYTHHSADINFNGRITEELRLHAGLQYRYSHLNRDEGFPDPYSRKYDFNTLSPSVSLMFNKGYYTPVWISYQATPGLPAVEQLSDRINDTDPYSLTAGNPRLKKEYSHMLMVMLRSSPTNNGSMVNGHIYLQKSSSAITQRTYFFTEDTTLPDHQGYVAPANSYLSIYDNIAGPLVVRADAGYETGINPISGRYVISGQYSYNKRPGYTDDRLNTVYTSSYSIRSQVSGSVKRHLRFTLTGAFTYNESWRNIGQDYRYITGSFSGEANSKFLKRLFLNARYTLNRHKTVTDAGSDQTVHLLNAVFGVNFMKNNAALSLSAYDILNKTTSFRSSMTQDYISNSWRPSFGRYWTFNFSYKFNTTNPGTTSRPYLNDGGNIGRF